MSMTSSTVTSAPQPLLGRPAIPVEQATIDQIVDAVTADPTHPRSRGAALAHRDYRSAAGSGEFGFFHALASVELRPDLAPRRVSNPMAGAAAAQTGEKRDLTVSDIAWLQTLPGDVKKLSDGDAAHLAKLRATVSSPSDRMLVDQRHGPAVKWFADRARMLEAERAWQLAERPPDPTRSAVYQRAVELIAHRVRRDTPDLNEGEARGRAMDLIRVRSEQRRASAYEECSAAAAVVREVCETHGVTSEVIPDVQRRAVPSPYPAA
jgi:hypothetical protein